MFYGLPSLLDKVIAYTALLVSFEKITVLTSEWAPDLIKSILTGRFQCFSQNGNPGVLAVALGEYGTYKLCD